MVNDRAVLQVDQDVMAALEYLQANVPAAKLVGVAEAINQVAPTLWGHFTPDNLKAVRLEAGPISAPRRLEAATE
jgi:hypothetical protein